jgi:hypothetical protein
VRIQFNIQQKGSCHNLGPKCKCGSVIESAKQTFSEGNCSCLGRYRRGGWSYHEGEGSDLRMAAAGEASAMDATQVWPVPLFVATQVMSVP